MTEHYCPTPRTQCPFSMYLKGHSSKTNCVFEGEQTMSCAFSLHSILLLGSQHPKTDCAAPKLEAAAFDDAETRDVQESLSPIGVSRRAYRSHRVGSCVVP